MTRKTIINCDQCGDQIHGFITTYGNSPMPGTSFTSYDGERFNWEFCSQGCLLTWIINKFHLGLEQHNRHAKWLWETRHYGDE